MAKKRKKKKSNSKKINNWGALFLLLLVTYSIWWLIKQAQQPQNPQQSFTNSLCHVKDAEMAHTPEDYYETNCKVVLHATTDLPPTTM